MNPQSGRWLEVPTPAWVTRGLGPSTSMYQQDLALGGWLTVIVSQDIGWHLSISHQVDDGSGQRPGRYPTWAEIADARYRFVPNDVTMAMVLPPREAYVNLHETTFHLYETTGDDSEVARWKAPPVQPLGEADRIQLVIALGDLAKAVGWRPVGADSSDERVTITLEPAPDQEYD